MHNQPRKMESNTFMCACMCMCVCMCPCLCTLAINNSQTNKGLHMKLLWHVTNVMINQILIEVKWENEILHMKWRVLQNTAVKRLNHLSNRNKQILKMNFKLLLKSIFVQNQSWRFSKDDQLSCSKFFELPHKKGRKGWFLKRIRYF